MPVESSKYPKVPVYTIQTSKKIYTGLSAELKTSEARFEYVRLAESSEVRVVPTVLLIIIPPYYRVYTKSVLWNPQGDLTLTYLPTGYPHTTQYTNS